MHVWLKASGTIFQSELQRLLTERLGVAWGPERNGCRDLRGFTAEQQRVFSKRTTAIETVLEAGSEAVVSRKERMRADEWASLKTRRRKDRTLTPERLRSRWDEEAATAGIPGPGRLQRTICHQPSSDVTVSRDDVFASLVDPELGLCATEARFNQAHVVERIAAVSAGRLTVDEIEVLAGEFLASELVVRLAPTDEAAQRRPPEWSTVEHRGIEDAVIANLDALNRRADAGIDRPSVLAALDHAKVPLGTDQLDAVDALCAPGAAVRVVLAPAGHGKTALVASATEAAGRASRPVVVLATTNKAVAELRAAGVDAHTIARFRLDGARLQPGSIVVVDEVSQVSTRDAHAILEAVATTPGATVWCLGDDGQGRSVRPGGLAVELRRRAEADQISSAELTVNRRQQDPAEQEALAAYRAGNLTDSQATRTAHGWEHEHATNAEARNALAAAAVADADRYGPANVAVLAVAHVDCEDIADRIRAARQARGELGGNTLDGPGWGPDRRVYAAGDRVLLHANLDIPGRYRVPNGTTGTVIMVLPSGLVTRMDDGIGEAMIPADFVRGVRPDGSPTVSHGWARTIDGAQGGTWEQVHLLATPTLDRGTAYVGQSRGRQPTHTWNTVPAVDYDHGNVVGDPRTPAERTLAAAARTPARSFAAYDDPFAIERRFLDERAEHEQALAAGLPDVARQLADARQRAERGERLCRAAWDQLNRCERQVDATGGVRQLRPARRRSHHDAIGARDHAAAELAERQAHLQSARATMLRLEVEAGARQRWEAANEWRHAEIARIDHRVADHWADTVLHAVRQDDPLAYGLGRLREARAIVAGRTLDPAAYPAQRSDLQLIDDTLGALRLERIERAVNGLDAAEHLVARLGPVPATAAGRDAWCGLADLLETRADHGITAGGTADRLDQAINRMERGTAFDVLQHPREVAAMAERLAATHGDLQLPPGPSRWHATVQDAGHHLETMHQRARHIDHGIGLSL